MYHAVREFEAGLEDVSSVEAGILVDLFLSYRGTVVRIAAGGSLCFNQRTAGGQTDCWDHAMQLGQAVLARDEERAAVAL